VPRSVYFEGLVRLLMVSLVARVTAIEVCTIICLGVYRHLVSGHEISRLQHSLSCIMLVTLADSVVTYT